MNMINTQLYGEQLPVNTSKMNLIKLTYSRLSQQSLKAQPEIFHWSAFSYSVKDASLLTTLSIGFSSQKYCSQCC